MKTLLKISVLLNLLLFACLSYALRTRTSAIEPQPATPPPASTIETTSIPPVIIQPKPFRWSQLESTNYLTYIQNLRGIGCPEQTVRDIITADVESLYQARAQRLRQTQSDSSAELEMESQRLAAEKASVIARLLGADATQLTAESSSAPSTNMRPRNGTAPTPLPLVWQDVDLSALNLNPDQKEAIASLRRDFMQKIGGANQDPSTPAYRERWQKAQPETDAALAGLVGRKEFLQMQALTSRTPSP